MTVEPDWTLEPYYLNRRRVISLAGGAAVQAKLDSVAGRSSSPGIQKDLELWAVRDVFQAWLLQNAGVVEPFEKLFVEGRLAPDIIFSTFKDFYGKGVRRARGGAKPQMHAHYEFTDRLTLRLELHQDHVASGSAGDHLCGHTSERLVVAVTDEVKPGEVTAIPIFIGVRVRGGRPILNMTIHADSREVQPEEIDAFSKIKSEERPTLAQLKVLRSIPENDIKRSFAEIIGEESVPKDWGGESSDLFCSHLTVRGSRLPTAFAFKGPGSGFSPMTFRQLGKNGDQIARLYTEPADLLVLQHCHEVRAPVRNTMRAFANQIGNPRLCCIIDGFDTLRILRAYGKCGQVHVERRERPPPRNPDEPPASKEASEPAGDEPERIR